MSTGQRSEPEVASDRCQLVLLRACTSPRTALLLAQLLAQHSSPLAGSSPVLLCVATGSHQSGSRDTCTERGALCGTCRASTRLRRLLVGAPPPQTRYKWSGKLLSSRTSCASPITLAKVSPTIQALGWAHVDRNALIECFTRCFSRVAAMLPLLARSICPAQRFRRVLLTLQNALYLACTFRTEASEEGC